MGIPTFYLFGRRRPDPDRVKATLVILARYIRARFGDGAAEAGRESLSEKDGHEERRSDEAAKGSRAAAGGWVCPTLG